MDIEIRANLPEEAAEVRTVIAAAFVDETVATLWEDLAARPRAGSCVPALLESRLEV
jgi:hypothetical protein